MTKPILVCMVWRGGERFARCLESIARSEHHFSRIVISVTSAEDSADMVAARAFQSEHSAVEVICPGRELPTMQHQAFWVDYLEATGARPEDWIYWLAYDDEVRGTGIDALVDSKGDWPLRLDTTYFGPWAMRHEGADHLWDGDPSSPLESWTSFPTDGPLRLPVMEWISDQLDQPTYIQMSGSVCPFDVFLNLRDGKPTKTGPMRIEMATAASGATTHVEEFPEPVSIIYGRANSDRANYGATARREDVHLIAWLARFSVRHPRQSGRFLRTAARQFLDRASGRPAASEEWRVRGSALP